MPTCACLPYSKICIAVSYMWQVVLIPFMLHLGRCISLRSMPRLVPACACLPYAKICKAVSYMWYPLCCTLGEASRFARCLALCLPVLGYPVLNLGFWLPRQPKSVKLILASGIFFRYPLWYLIALTSNTTIAARETARLQQAGAQKAQLLQNSRSRQHVCP